MALLFRVLRGFLLESGAPIWKGGTRREKGWLPFPEGWEPRRGASL